MEEGRELVTLVREPLVLSRRVVRLSVRRLVSLRNLGLLFARFRNRRADVELGNGRAAVVQLLPIAEASLLRLVF